MLVRLFNERARIDNRTVRSRQLQQHGEGFFAEIVGRFITDDHPEAQRGGAGLNHGNGLRMALAGNENRLRVRHFAECAAEVHGLGRGGPFVEHRSVSDVHPG